MAVQQVSLRFGTHGSTVTVTDQGTSTLVPLFSDAAGTTPLANPITVSPNGHVDFYVAAGHYDLTEAGNGTDKLTLTAQAPTPNAASPAGAPALKAFPFDYSTAGLAGGVDTGYSPAVGDILLNAWIEVVTAWDGTTPRADFGYFLPEDGGGGVLAYATGQGVDLTSPSATNYNLPNAMTTATGSMANADLISQGASASGATGVAIVPSRFTESHPIKIVVSRSAHLGDAATGSTAGSAVLYLLVATPDSA